jgi:hypothetical protein
MSEGCIGEGNWWSVEQPVQLGKKSVRSTDENDTKDCV